MLLLWNFQWWNVSVTKKSIALMQGEKVGYFPLSLWSQIIHKLWRHLWREYHIFCTLQNPFSNFYKAHNYVPCFHAKFLSLTNHPLIPMIQCSHISLYSIWSKSTYLMYKHSIRTLNYSMRGNKRPYSGKKEKNKW